MLLELRVGLEPNLALDAFGGVARPVVMGALLLVFESLVACRASDMARQVVLAESFLGSGEVLVLDAYEVFDGIVEEVCGEGCSTVESQVADMVISADMLLVVTPMLFEFPWRGVANSTVGAPGIAVVTRNVGCTGSRVVKSLHAHLTAAVWMSSTNVVFKICCIGLVIATFRAEGVSMSGGGMLIASHLGFKDPLALLAVTFSVSAIEVGFQTCFVGIVVLAFLAVGEQMDVVVLPVTLASFS